MNTPTRKPRIALMGEFSSGKSTLSNLMLGARPLPERVTATRLSPVWMSHGTQPAYRVDVDGTEEPVDVNELETIDVEATRVIRLFFEADILEVCDLIDFPGISDPNMSSDVWQRMLTEVDAVLWCTHATQAWRQSEAAVWESVPDAVKERSVLLVTKYDKLITERDKYRVVARLEKETEGQFAALFPISLTKAIAAGDDYDAFNASGGGAFLEHLINLIEELNTTVSQMTHSVYEMAMSDINLAAIGSQDTDVQGSEVEVAQTESLAQTDTDTPQTSLGDEQQPVAKVEETVATASARPVIEVESNKPIEPVESTMPVEQKPNASNTTDRIVPRRIRPNGNTQSARPRRPAAAPKISAVDDADLNTPSRRPAKQANTSQLRAIFSAENEAT